MRHVRARQRVCIYTVYIYTHIFVYVWLRPSDRGAKRANCDKDPWRPDSKFVASWMVLDGRTVIFPFDNVLSS